MSRLCAVSSDLSAYLAQLDREDAQARAEEAKVDEWMADPERVRETWSDWLSDNCDSFDHDVVGALMGHKVDRTARAVHLLDLIEEKVRERLEAEAADAVEREREAAEEDAAVSAYEDREDARYGGW